MAKLGKYTTKGLSVARSNSGSAPRWPAPRANPRSLCLYIRNWQFERFAARKTNINLCDCRWLTATWNDLSMLRNVDPTTEPPSIAPKGRDIKLARGYDPTTEPQTYKTNIFMETRQRSLHAWISSEWEGSEWRTQASYGYVRGVGGKLEVELPALQTSEMWPFGAAQEAYTPARITWPS